MISATNHPHGKHNQIYTLVEESSSGHLVAGATSPLCSNMLQETW